MPGPQSQVADLIMQLMTRGHAGGLPMQPSPELAQYLAHAQLGTATPGVRQNTPAPVLPGPGAGQSGPSPLDMMTDSPGHLPTGTFRQPSESGNFSNTPLYIWMMHPKTGKRIRLDGPFSSDIEAARELRTLREAGLNDSQVEIAPDFDSYR